MDEHIFDKIHEVDMQKTMESYYIDYAMSVIASRALPDKDSLIVKIFFQQGNDKRVQKSTANTFFLHENVCCAYGSVF